MTLAQTADVEVRLARTLAGAELAFSQALLVEVSAMARLAVPGLDAQIGADANFDAVVVGRIAGAVVRVLRNPDGLVLETVDDYTRRRAEAVADGTLHLSVADLAALRSGPGAVSAGRSVVGSQKLAARGYTVE